MKLYGEISRLKGITSSPLVSCFSETLNGCSVLRVHDQFERNFVTYHKLQDEWFKNCLIVSATLGWFNIRISILSLSIVVPAICMAVKI